MEVDNGGLLAASLENTLSLALALRSSAVSSPSPAFTTTTPAFPSSESSASAATLTATSEASSGSSSIITSISTSILTSPSTSAESSTESTPESSSKAPSASPEPTASPESSSSSSSAPASSTFTLLVSTLVVVVIISRGCLSFISGCTRSSAPYIPWTIPSELTTTAATSATPAITFTTLFSILLFISSLTSALSTPTTPAICSIGRPFDRSSLWPRDVGSLVALLSDHNVKLNNLAIADRPDSFLRVVLDDGSLVNKDIFLGVVPVDESISRLDVEPFHRAAHLGGDHLLYRFLLLLHLLHLCLLFHSLLLGGLGVRVSHDVSLALMVTNFPSSSFTYTSC